MSQRKKILITLISFGLAACGPINSNFSCNATAGDSCLTIEQVDAMTRFADYARPYGLKNKQTNTKNAPLIKSGRKVKQSNGQALWLAPTVKGQSWA
ncbi:conjugal transfer protein [Legionella sp. WA2024007413]